MMGHFQRAVDEEADLLSGGWIQLKNIRQWTFDTGDGSHRTENNGEQSQNWPRFVTNCSARRRLYVKKRIERKMWKELGMLAMNMRVRAANMRKKL
jgi:hypothetical protein